MPNLNDLDDRWPTEDPTPDLEEEEDGMIDDGERKIEMKITVPKDSELGKWLKETFNPKYTLKQKIYIGFMRMCLKLGLLKPVKEEFGLYRWFWVKERK